MFFGFFLKKYKNFLFLYLFSSFYLSFCVHILFPYKTDKQKPPLPERLFFYLSL